MNYPDWLDQEVWAKFEIMRVLIKRPMTEYAEELIIKRLDKFRQEEQDPTAILEQSIINCWQNVYRVKDDGSDNFQPF